MSYAEVVIPDEIKNALNKNVEDCNPITLVWQSNYSTDMNFETLCKKLKFPDFYGFYTPVNSILMWQNDCFFHNRTHKEFLNSNNKNSLNAWELEKNDTKLYNRIDDYSYNGEMFFFGNDAEKTNAANPTLSIIPLTQINMKDLPTFISQQYTTFLGIKFPNGSKEIGTRQESYVLYLARKGIIIDTQKDILDNQDVFVITIKAYNIFAYKDCIFRFYLFPSKNYAIGRLDIMSLNGQLMYQIENSNFIEVKGKSLYLPRNTHVYYYTFGSMGDEISSTILFKEIYDLKNYSLNKIKQNQFDLRLVYLTPGTRIADFSLKDTEFGLQYDVPANPADLDRVIESALTGKDFTPTPLPSRAAMIIRWILILAGISMILYAGYRKFIQKI
ncbi:MAG: hypothetical protein LBJ67_16235 [Planctomycetaceae bacterium]|nr:hypothetical protein [Planctomycetaceae bacterium]